MSHQVFISYSTGDTPAAERVRDRLESGGIRCWMAPRDMKYFLPYGESIVRALMNCRVVVVVFSASANDSRYVQREVERGVAHRKSLATIRLENVQPSGELEFFLSNLHWLDAFGPQSEAKLDELVANVNRLLESPETPPTSPQATRQFDSPRIPDGPQRAEEAWMAANDRDECRAAIRNLVDRMVRNRQAVASLAGACDADHHVLRGLEAADIVRFQRSPMSNGGDHVTFASQKIGRLALADWLDSQMGSPSFELQHQVQQFPLLADGITQLIHNRWNANGREILKRCVLWEHATAERLVAGVVAGWPGQTDLQKEVRALVLAQGGTSALRGLARGAQRLMEAGDNESARQIYGELGDTLRQRPYWTASPETRIFLVEIANELGRILKREDKLREATDHFRHTLEEAVQAGDDELIGTVTNNLASCLLATAARSEKINAEIHELLTANERRLRSVGCLRQRAITFHNLGRFYYASDPERAESCFHEDVSICRGMNDPLALADALNSLGVFLAGQDRHEDADVAHKEEVDLFTSVYDPPRHARALAASGANCLAQGFPARDQAWLERARGDLQESVEVYRRLDQPPPREHAAALENLGRTCFLLGDTVRGKELLLEAADLNERWVGGAQIARQIRKDINELNCLE